jgi:hypothetical protein
VKLPLDEMYPAALAEALRDKEVETATVAALGLTGRSDADVFAAAVADGYAVVTQNVADCARIAGEHVARGPSPSRCAGRALLPVSRAVPLAGRSSSPRSWPSPGSRSTTESYIFRMPIRRRGATRIDALDRPGILSQ